MREKKARREIEECVLRCSPLRPAYAARSDYILSITYYIDAELDQAIYEILPKTERLADLRYCFIEADVIALDGSERS